MSCNLLRLASFQEILRGEGVACRYERADQMIHADTVEALPTHGQALLHYHTEPLLLPIIMSSALTMIRIIVVIIHQEFYLSPCALKNSFSITKPVLIFN